MFRLQGAEGAYGVKRGRSDASNGRCRITVKTKLAVEREKTRTIPGNCAFDLSPIPGSMLDSFDALSLFLLFT